ncbi:FAD:protein FMN transferase [soil metagenome]
MRRVFETMGTVASIEVPEQQLSAIPAIEAAFDEIDRRFSLYRADSELSRIARGELRLPDAGPDVIASYSRALAWRDSTGGAFTPHRPDGALDLNGIVKAEAIERAGGILDAAGCTDWTINVGGDILTRYASAAGSAAIGIVDPGDGAALLCSLVLRGDRRALATSGSAERGDHIWLGGSTARADFTQVSVIAEDIVTADVLATAIVAGGRDALDDATARWPIDVLTVDRAGDLLATPGMRASLQAN